MMYALRSQGGRFVGRNAAPSDSDEQANIERAIMFDNEDTARAVMRNTLWGPRFEVVVVKLVVVGPTTGGTDKEVA